MINIKYLLLPIAIVLFAPFCISQSTVDLTATFTLSEFNSDYLIIHSPTKDDTILYKQNKRLINLEPTKDNYKEYYALACGLWELNKLSKAEKMFMKITNSSKDFFTETIKYYSDIQNDTNTYLYNYGSYTFNYKHYSSKYLAKIYIENKKFDKALKYLEYADKQYKIEYNCGTGNNTYRKEIDGLYGICYENLSKYDSIVNILLPQYADYQSETLIRALQKIYTPKEIRNYLLIAENSIVCTVDTAQSSAYITRYSEEKKEETKEIRYTSGTGIITLFNKQIALPIPNLDNGETITRELFIRDFKKSLLYKRLNDNQ